MTAGHVHRPVTAAFAGSVPATAPSTRRRSGPALRDAVPGHLPEPMPFLPHLLAGDVWVTHTVPVGHGAGVLSGY